MDLVCTVLVEMAVNDGGNRPISKENIFTKRTGMACQGNFGPYEILVIDIIRHISDEYAWAQNGCLTCVPHNTQASTSHRANMEPEDNPI